MQSLWKEVDFQLSTDLGKTLVKDFLRTSYLSIETIVRELSCFEGNKARKFCFYYIKNGRRKDFSLDANHFFLRVSVEYSNPQLTLEELQGIITARLLEVYGNYFYRYGLHEIHRKDIDKICEMLNKPSQGIIFPFLLNTDDAEPDRYSINPLKSSILNSGQSAFPSASVKTELLEIDNDFVQKYTGLLITDSEVGLIERVLKSCNNSYLDAVDSVKYEQLEELSEAFGMNLCLYSLRMPLTILEKETPDDLLHHLIKRAHANFQSIEQIYKSMGRSMTKRTTLLTVPHSERGYGSKRAARGKLYFNGSKLRSLKVRYKTSLLYPNAIDPTDVSIAQADDNFTVNQDKLVKYNFLETPSSPQFILYSLASPENAAIWHGIGAFGAAELLKSYVTIRLTSSKNLTFENVREKYGVSWKIPLQFNITPDIIWFHPKHRNIDASIGCIGNLDDLAKIGIKLECLPAAEYVRKQN